MGKEGRALLFAMLLVGAFCLRVAFNLCELPPVSNYPDEIRKNVQALSLPENGFDHGKAQPSFLVDSLWLLYFPARWVYSAGTALFPTFGPFGLDLPRFYLWVGRTYMALIGALTILAVFFLGKRIHSPAAGWIAALALAVAPIHVLGCRFTKEDIPFGLFATVALIFLLDVVRHGRRGDSMRAGFACGMCLAAKWLGAVTVIAALAAHLLRRVAENEGEGAGAASPPARFRWAFSFFVLGFFAFSPDMLAHPDLLYKGLLRGVEKSYTEHSDGMNIHPMEEGFSDYFRSGLWPGLTPPLLALGLLGMAGFGRRRPREAWLLGGSIFFFYLILETAPARPYPHYQRYLQPIIPALAALSAAGTADLAGWLRRRMAARRCSERIALAAVTVLALAWPLHDTLLYLWNIPKSTIYKTIDFLNENIPPGSLIVDDHYGPMVKPLGYDPMSYRDGDRLTVGVFPPRDCYVMFSDFGLGRYLEHPDGNPEITSFVYYVLAVGELVADIRPAFRSFYCESPRIRIFHIPAAAPTFVGPVLEAKGEDVDQGN